MQANIKDCHICLKAKQISPFGSFLFQLTWLFAVLFFFFATSHQPACVKYTLLSAWIYGIYLNVHILYKCQASACVSRLFVYRKSPVGSSCPLMTSLFSAIRLFWICCLSWTFFMFHFITFYTPASVAFFCVGSPFYALKFVLLAEPYLTICSSTRD